ncbi:MAG: TIGR02757 family protein [bacterium]
MQNMALFLDNLVKKYETPDFIPDDPVKFPHIFNNQQDQEISGLISSCLAYGKREKIIESIQKIHEIFKYEPYKFTMNFDLERDSGLFSNFLYRYTPGKDIALLIFIINKALTDYITLENLFLNGFSKDDKNIKQGLINFINKLYSYIPDKETDLKGIYYLIPNPQKGSACKRLNLFLRWMVRQGPVDLDLWKEIPADKLIIPLDVHVAKQSRTLKLTARKTNDWKTAEEITENLKKFDAKDPVKYDFAIFSMGISKDSQKYQDF